MKMLYISTPMKPWKGRKECAGCVYCRPLANVSPVNSTTNCACHFMYDTGEKRGCPRGKIVTGELKRKEKENERLQRI